MPTFKSNNDSIKKVYVIGTYDTKARELQFIKENILSEGVEVCTVDVSARLENSSRVRSPADISPAEVASFHPGGKSLEDIFLDDRGEAIVEVIMALTAFIKSRTDIAGVIGVGGTGGTALLSPAMRCLPIGLPKILVSTVASGNTAPYVGSSDIMMVNSVCDISGLNRITRPIFANAARAITGARVFGQENAHGNNAKRSANMKSALGFTMFGVTTPCIEGLIREFSRDYECLVFHATGAGGRAMEELVDRGEIDAVFDLTTTEIADMVAGGVFNAVQQRLNSIIEKKVPYIGACGALELINFGTPDTIPARYADRLFHQHNPQVTLMRSSAEDNKKIGQFIAEKLNRCEGPVTFLIPEKGMSSLSTAGQVFHQPELDEVLFSTMGKRIYWRRK